MRRYRVENIDFYDLTAIIERDWILEFCRLLDARGLRITWQLPSGTRSEALDEPVLRAMYRSGCRNVSYAPESGSPRTLEAIKKKVKLERLEASMRAAVRVGLNVKANILIGFPDEQRDGPARDAALHPAHGAHRRARRLGVDVLAVSRARSCSSGCAPPGGCRASTTTTTPRCSRTPTSPAPSRTPTRSIRRSCSATASPGCCSSTAPAISPIRRARCARSTTSPRGATSRAWRCRSATWCAGCRRRARRRRRRSARHVRHLRPRAPRHRGAVGVGAPGRATSRRWSTRRGRSRRAAAPIRRCWRACSIRDPRRPPSASPRRGPTWSPSRRTASRIAGRSRWRARSSGAATVPIVFGGPHVSAAPERAIREWSIDAVVEGEGEGALVDLIECAERGRFGRTDVANCTFKGDGGADAQSACGRCSQDLDALPWADKQRLLRRGAGVRARVLRRVAARLSVPLQLLRVQHLPASSIRARSRCAAARSST